MTHTADGDLGLMDAARMDRLVSTTLFAIAILCLGGAGVLLLNGFIEYLQSGSWKSTSLLQLGYESHVVRARWFLRHDWSWWIHDLLEVVPTYAALLGIAPVSWWLSRLVAAR